MATAELHAGGSRREVDIPISQLVLDFAVTMKGPST